MMEEYKEEYPEELASDVATKLAFQQDFSSYKSDSVDYILEHHREWSGTLVLFYDSRQYDEKLIRLLAVRLLDMFTDLNRGKLEGLKLASKTRQLFE
jgi:hypothetical protein